ncbi:MAG: carboxypeptidase regulatory-like domain-containing protein [Bacteroidota bacterium]
MAMLYRFLPGILFCLALLPGLESAHSQSHVQDIYGVVTDIHTGITLPGATVVLTSTEPARGVTSDAKGQFSFSEVPVGRHSIRVSFMGYKAWEASNFLVQSGRETFVEVRLEESVLLLQEVVIEAKAEKDLSLNEMAMVSARMFTVEETDRYAGSMGDPARMASNFAGVATLNDQSNDIVIRGNSPFGLLYNLEGVDIPNPNHFGAIGATGGPISMLNNNTLANSDFLSGAFPATYGNALSGVFDLKLRQGNTRKYQMMAQMGFNGFEAGIEGPLSRKNNTSFLAHYRYSTLGVLDKIYGLEKMALMAVPYFQDVNFNATLYRSKKGRISIFGLLGKSHIDIAENTSDPATWDHQLFGQQTRSEGYNGTSGIKHWWNPRPDVLVETTLAATHISSRFRTDTIVSGMKEPTAQQRLINQETTLFLSSHITWKKDVRNIFKAGSSFQPMLFLFTDSIYRTFAQGFVKRYDVEGRYSLSKSYLQWKHNFTDELAVSTGINVMYFTSNDHFSVEPRLALRWMFSPGKSLSFASGLHGHLAPRIFYVANTTDEEGVQHKINPDLDFTRSLQMVAGYDHRFATHIRFKLEAYYQYHYNVPVSVEEPGWSLLNYGSDYADFLTPSHTLVNEGTGENFGVELTLERFVDQGFYYLFTASLYESKYKGLDGITRNTGFNGNYIFNALGGKEFKVKTRNVVSVDLRVVWAGGRPFLPYSAEQIGENMFVRRNNWQEAYTEQMKDYFRMNLRLGYSINLLHTTHELAVDLYNITNRKNIFMQNFDPITGETSTLYQFSFLPIVLYRVMF